MKGKATLCFQFRPCFLVQRFSRWLPGQRSQGCLGLHGTVYERRVDQVLAQLVLIFSKTRDYPKKQYGSTSDTVHPGGVDRSDG
jgi:hypothetical protein